MIEKIKSKSQTQLSRSELRVPLTIPQVGSPKNDVPSKINLLLFFNGDRCFEKMWIGKAGKCCWISTWKVKFDGSFESANCSSSRICSSPKTDNKLTNHRLVEIRLKKEETKRRKTKKYRKKFWLKTVWKISFVRFRRFVRRAMKRSKDQWANTSRWSFCNDWQQNSSDRNDKSKVSVNILFRTDENTNQWTE